jgi:hypothetical protein
VRGEGGGGVLVFGEEAVEEGGSLLVGEGGRVLGGGGGLRAAGFGAEELVEDGVDAGGGGGGELAGVDQGDQSAGGADLAGVWLGVVELAAEDGEGVGDEMAEVVGDLVPGGLAAAVVLGDEERVAVPPVVEGLRVDADQAADGVGGVAGNEVVDGFELLGVEGARGV